MTTLRETAQMALEVLSEILDTGGSFDAEESVAALRAALEQPEPPCPYVRHGSDGTHWCALAEQSAQPATITSPRGSLGEPIV